MITEEKCIHCSYSGHSVRKHLSKQSRCREKYSVDELKTLEKIKKNEKLRRQKMKYGLTKANNKEHSRNKGKVQETVNQQQPSKPIEPKLFQRCNRECHHPPSLLDLNPKSSNVKEEEANIINWKKTFDMKFNRLYNLVRRQKEDSI